MSRLGENWQRSSLLRLKGGVTMSIMITCVIYHFLLAPIATNFYTLENFLCHYIVPLWFLADTLFFDKQGQYKIWDPIVWTILPLLYMIFALFNGLSLIHIYVESAMRMIEGTARSMGFTVVD